MNRIEGTKNTYGSGDYTFFFIKRIVHLDSEHLKIFKSASAFWEENKLLDRKASIKTRFEHNILDNFT